MNSPYPCLLLPWLLTHCYVSSCADLTTLNARRSAVLTTRGAQAEPRTVGTELSWFLFHGMGRTWDLPHEISQFCRLICPSPVALSPLPSFEMYLVHAPRAFIRFSLHLTQHGTWSKINNWINKLIQINEIIPSTFLDSKTN